MSVTISNCSQICNAPTNHSSAKMLYSFPKQSRFLKRKTVLYCCAYVGVIDSMRSRILAPIEARALDTAPSMILPRNLPPPLRPIPIISPMMSVLPATEVSPSEKVERR
jgi:hypothetical protein